MMVTKMGKSSRLKRRARAALHRPVVAFEPAAPPPVRLKRQREDIDELARLWARRSRIDADMATLVGTLRAAGVTWSAIGRATGVSPQGAMSRWRSVAPKRTVRISAG